jgi:hypothetical protein
MTTHDLTDSEFRSIVRLVFIATIYALVVFVTLLK